MLPYVGYLKRKNYLLKTYNSGTSCNIGLVWCSGEIAALILARGGSKGVRLKNLQTVGGTTLLRRAINTALKAGINDVTVSTDHPVIALEAIKSGASLFHRSRITATDGAPSIWGASEFLAAKPHVTVLVLIQATSPFTQASQVQHAVKKLNSPKAYDCVFSVVKSFKLRWRYDNSDYVTALNFQIEARPRRQDWNGELVETGAFYITRRFLIEKGSFQNNNAVCRLPPKRMVVGGGSPLFLQRRRAALQRWLTLVARHPVLAHDADLRTFLCETTVRLDKPKHDEFMLAGSQEDIPRDMTTEDMQAAFVCEQEQLRLIQLGLGRLFKICEKVESRSEAERADIRELGAGLNALSAPVAADSPRWSHVKESLRAAAQLATEMGEARNGIEEAEFTEEGAGGRVQLALEALGAFRELCARLTRGLHAERAAAAAHAPHSPAAHALRLRHGYALRAALEEARVGRAYALGALESLPELFGAHGEMRARAAALWSALNAALAPTPARAHQPRLYRGPVHGHS
ncbi:uncharacterized protein LOC131852500 isoform X2 [Achroia grisella]|uniref:uncharacterized protein LOC131852500 isoform X2 n=1 Tax=Achroia grisella TaxID=688607 RepID=UPI0027D297CF|nr:uncharacterized protein LOC131852500 isoform X2 [Achroia grisella]